MLTGWGGLQEGYWGSQGATGALAHTGAVSGGFPEEVTFTVRQEAKKKGRHTGWGRESFSKRKKKWEMGEEGGPSRDPFSLPLGLGSASTHCLLSPCCRLGSLPEERPSFASFTPPLPPSLSSGPPLAPLLPEQQFPGSPTTDTLLPGPMCPPATWHFPGLPLLAGLGQGAGERLRLFFLRPEGLEVKAHPLMGGKGYLDPWEGFFAEMQRPKPGEESLRSPNLENFEAEWTLDPP